MTSRRALLLPVAIATAMLILGVGAAPALAADCDDDGVDDQVAIAEGIALDCDGNGIPDVCDLEPIILFETGIRSALASDPISFALGHLNDDGILDLVVGHSDPDRITAHRGLGDGGFELIASTAAPGVPRALVLADVDGDGLDDVAVTVPESRLGTDGVAVFISRGDGRFASPTIFPTGLAPTDVAAADLNGDSRVDLISTNSNSDTISVLIGDGEGRFSAASDSMAGDTPTRVAVGDLDLDGAVDLVVANQRDLSVFRGRGDGTLDPELRLGGTQSTTNISIADLNHDGRPDIVFSGGSGSRIGIHRGQIDGSFTSAPGILVHGSPHDQAIGDIDGDGRLELLLGVGLGGGVQVLEFDASFTPGTPTTWLAGEMPFAIALADLDSDSRADLLTLDRDPSGITVCLGTGDRRFSTARVFPPPANASSAWRNADALRVARLDTDLQPDLVTLASSGRHLMVWFGEIDGTFRLPVSLPGSVNGSDFTIVDLDGDGLLDVLMPDETSNELRFLVNDGARSFTPVAIEGAVAPRNLAVGHLDEDGRLDVVTTGYRSDLVSILLSGDGGFRPSLLRPVGQRPVDVTIADLDQDGIADIAVANERSDDLTLIYGDSDGAFERSRTILTRNDPRSLLTSDLDDDRHADLVVTFAISSDVALYLSSRGGLQSAPRILSLDGPVSRLRIVDFDADGRQDLAYLAESPFLRLARGRGAAVFEGGPSLPLGGEASDFAFEFLPGTSLPVSEAPSLLAVHYRSGAVSITTNLTRRQSGSDCNQNGVPDACEISEGTSLDVDRDGQPDECELDCDRNGVPDDSELESGAHTDCDATGIPDACEIASGISADCNANGLPDPCDIRTGTSRDLDDDGLPDECQVDCDGDGVPDSLAVISTPWIDCDANGLPDACEIATDPARDCDASGVLDVCETRVEPRWIAPIRVSGLFGGRNQHTLGDVDGDGIRELLIAQSDRAALLVFDRRGDFDFFLAATIPLESNALTVTAGDLDADGADDVVVGHESGHSVLLANGTGGFRSVSYHEDGAGGEHFAALADLDADGTVDLTLISSLDSRMSVFRGLGTGDLLHVRDVSLAGLPYVSRSIDVDGDSRPEVVVGVTGEITVYFDLLGEDPPRSEPRSLANQFRPISLVFADWDQDDVLDLTWLEGSGGRFITHLGRGDGTFRVATTTLLENLSLSSLWSMDLDGDELPELIASTQQLPDLRVYRPAGEREPFVSGESTPVGAPSLTVELDDVDRDGRLDVLLLDTTDLLIVRGGPQGLQSWQEVTPFEGRVDSVLAADLDGDGLGDIAVAETERSRVAILWGEQRFTTERSEFVLPGRAASIAAEDVDGDGKLDLICSVANENELTILLQRDGREFEMESLPLSNRPRKIVLEDVVDDDSRDLIVRTFDEIFILPGLGGGAFAPPRRLEVAWGGRDGLAVGDLDGDGVPEIVIAVRDQDSNSDGIVSYTRVGESSFEPGPRIPTGNGIQDLALTDFDRDGTLDAVVTCELSNTVEILRGTGSGQFVPASLRDTGLHVRQLRVADFDQDGAPDVVTRNSTDRKSQALVLLGNGRGAFRESRAFGIGPSSSAGLAVLDLDGDGRLEIIATNSETRDLSILENDSAAPLLEDCDEDGVPDECQLANGDPLADANGNGVLDACEPVSCRVPGDCNENGRLEVGDAICLFGALFLGNPPRFPCGSGARDDPANHRLLDWQPDGRVDISDGIGALEYLFLGGPPHHLAVPGKEGAGCAPMPGCDEPI